jgi:glycosyltransferase involved in cell wall biosynthesis
MIEQHPIHVSNLQTWARRVGDYRRLLPFLPSAVERWDFDRFDLVISSSHCVAKGAITRGVPHVTYCHTPMRYIWDRFDDYFPPSRPLQRFAMSVMAPRLRRWDRDSASRVNRFVANSEFVRQRIERFYDREADVVHPFVDRSFLEGSLLPAEAGSRLERPADGSRSGDDRTSGYDLVLSALVPYKKVDLAIEAARLSGRHLRIVGSGPLLEELAESAPPNVEMLGHVSSSSVRDLARGARCLIIPGVEDFGITALEAMACGTPVVAVGEGGALDSVIPGVTGLLFQPASAAALAATCAEADGIAWDREALRLHAATFSKERFQTAFASILMEELGPQ